MRIFLPCLGPLYFHAILYNLVSRKTLRELLDRNLDSQGVDRLGSSGLASSKQSASIPVHITVDQVFVHHLRSDYKKASVNRDQATSLSDEPSWVDLGSAGWNPPFSQSVTAGQSSSQSEADQVPIRQV